MTTKSGLEIFPSTELQFVPAPNGGHSEARINLRNSNQNGQAIAFKIRAKNANLCSARPNVGFIPAGGRVTIVFKSKSGILRENLEKKKEKNDQRLICIDSQLVPNHLQSFDSNALKFFWSESGAKLIEKVVFWYDEICFDSIRNFCHKFLFTVKYIINLSLLS